MCSPRPGVGVIERYDSACQVGFIIAETGERRRFSLGHYDPWIPQAGETVVFARLWDRRGLRAAAVTPFRTAPLVIHSLARSGAH
ncbi:MAG: hypothetical protein Q7W02_00110 [Candidatus Rokubacteria bacterium]|nr:hypothetical protein [Candidatus Rokubacteria bacterium]